MFAPHDEAGTIPLPLLSSGNVPTHPRRPTTRDAVTITDERTPTPQTTTRDACRPRPPRTNHQPTQPANVAHDAHKRATIARNHPTRPTTQPKPRNVPKSHENEPTNPNPNDHPTRTRDTASCMHPNHPTNPTNDHPETTTAQQPPTRQKSRRLYTLKHQYNNNKPTI